jgi:hypothetical protein
VYTGQAPYQVWPTLYLLDRDGQVVWSDGAARPRHRLSPDELVRELDEQIEHGLADVVEAD